LHRPNPHWVYTDPAGHEHRWYVRGIHDRYEPARGYNPELTHLLPTTVVVTDIEATDDYPAVTHLECLQCRAHITPGYTSDDDRQYIRGHARYRINGVEATYPEVQAAFERNGITI
jgi:hypothetical protein